jgi:broad specificity phosphatase PhoE
VVSEILLLRHGQASFGSADYDKLSEKGEAQVRMLGEHLSELGLEFEAVFSGSMRRQRDSARLMLEAMGHTDPQGFSLLQQFDEFDHLPVLRDYLQGRAELGDREVDIQRLSQDRAFRCRYHCMDFR